MVKIRKCDFCGKGAWDENLMWKYNLTQKGVTRVKFACVDCHKEIMQENCRFCDNKGFLPICKYCSDLSMCVRDGVPAIQRD